jgi:putative flavoprotein involved in K+ transport
MPSTHTVVVGAGQAGLAMSRCLSDADVEHVVLERGRIAERWHSERWDSLRLLTPNWASRLPGWSYHGPDPDGFMTATELAAYLGAYAQSFDAPVEELSPVQAVTRSGDGFAVRTPDATWHAANVVVATGWCDRPRVPADAAHVGGDVAQITPGNYRNPAQLPEGAVLVVGASATGVQVADELVRAGREVVLAVGGHSRVPRRYRGMDIWWWLDRIGTFARTIDDVRDPLQARDEGSLQLVGREDRRDVDLPTLQRLGVRLAGRLASVDADHVSFADDLAATAAAADERLARLLDQIDDHIAASGLAPEVLPASGFARLSPVAPLDRLDLRADGVGTVVWATGYRRTYPWLHVPVLDGHGEIAHRRGVTPVRGLYVLGQRFQHRRDSNFIDGVRHDAEHLARAIVARHHRHPAPASTSTSAATSTSTPTSANERTLPS